jgi:hypothetical protein
MREALMSWTASMTLRTENSVGFELHRSRSRLRVREDLFDHREQLPARSDDGLDRLPLPIVQLTEKAIAEYLPIRDDRREWGAKLVGDIGEELRLRDVEVAKLPERDFQLLDLSRRLVSFVVVGRLR